MKPNKKNLWSSLKWGVLWSNNTPSFWSTTGAFLIDKWGVCINDGTFHINVAPIWHFVDILITDIEKYFQADKFNIAFHDYLVRHTSRYEALLNSEDIKPVALYGTLVWRNYNSVAFRVSYINLREWLDVSFHTTSMGFTCLSHILSWMDRCIKWLLAYWISLRLTPIRNFKVNDLMTFWAWVCLTNTA